MGERAVSDAALQEIYNYERMDASLGTSGQPTADQFAAIADAGFKAVVNLALADSDRAVPNEGSIVTGLGMRYFHIPVAFEQPTLRDLRTFFGVMRAVQDEPVWVHCVVNARVSAFVYHYLRYEQGKSDQHATSNLLTQWLPQMDDVWREFLEIRADQI